MISRDAKNKHEKGNGLKSRTRQGCMNVSKLMQYSQQRPHHCCQRLLTLNTSQWAGKCPKNRSFSWENPGPHVIHSSVGAPSTYTEWHLDWFSRFSTAHGLTDRQTTQVCLQCFDAVGWATGRASGLWWGARVVVCLERGADLHMAQLIPLPLTVSCFSEIHIGFTSLVPAHPGSPKKDR